MYLTKDSWAFEQSTYGSFECLAISKNGDYIVGGGAYIYYFSKKSPTAIWTYNTEEFPSFSENLLNTAAISDDGDLMVLGFSYGQILFFEGSKPTPVWKYIGGTINSIDMSGNGDYIAAATETNLLFFTKNNSTPLWNCSGSQDFVEITSDGNYIFAGNEKRITIFSKSSPTPLWIFNVSSNIKDMAVSDNGKTIIVGCEDGMIFLFAKPWWTNTGEHKVRPYTAFRDGCRFGSYGVPAEPFHEL